jgi:hydrogenase maturation factor HypF (carbamoyltransferase family)
MRGTVQGVGFRPYVYRLAGELSLAGFVCNDSRGVVIEAEAEAEQHPHWAHLRGRVIEPVRRLKNRFMKPRRGLCKASAPRCALDYALPAPG